MDQLLIDRLLKSENPSIRWKALVNIMGLPRSDSSVVAAEAEVKESSLAKGLLQKLGSNGAIKNFRGVYDKWQGSHWTLLNLSDIGYPQGDKRLNETVEELYSVWLAPRFFRQVEVQSGAEGYRHRDAIPIMQGRVRTCASQQGNCLFSTMKLGIHDERVHTLADLLMQWRWPDGGWNCDKNPNASTSTFIHTLWSMRGLGIYAREYGSREASKSVERAAEFLLSRQLFLSRRSGKIIREEFIKLHYPLYWHYDVLGALKAFAEIGFPKDPRMEPALRTLSNKELATGGWPAEAKYSTGPRSDYALGNDYVDWGGVSKKSLNEWITADVLFVTRVYGH